METAFESDGRAKLVSLTQKGQATLAACPDALESIRLGQPDTDQAALTIASGYQTGMIGRAVEMHARYYRREAGFGHVFEVKVAAQLAAFSLRPNHDRSAIWTARHHGEFVDTLAIHGRDLGPDTAHLRWFNLENGVCGRGIDRRLLAEALRFCDRAGFQETCLSTSQDLDTALPLYESSGFFTDDPSRGAGHSCGRSVTRGDRLAKGVCPVASGSTAIGRASVSRSAAQNGAAIVNWLWCNKAGFVVGHVVCGEGGFLAERRPSEQAICDRCPF